jgi:hypothetical protein
MRSTSSPAIFPRVLRGLALAVVEIRRHGDDGLGDLLAQVGLGGLLELAQNHPRDLGRGVLLAPDLDPDVAVRRLDDLVGDELDLLLDLVVAPAHEPLDREHGVLRIRHGLPLGDLADEDLAVLGEGDHRGVMRLPSWLGTTRGSPPSITATTEFVVPRSMPITFPCCPPYGFVQPSPRS